jgi:hypothetical protein
LVALLSHEQASADDLFYTLLKLRLPLRTKAHDPGGLAFDFLGEGPLPVFTGHDNGLSTINLAEADDAERERRRHQMGEPYRTLLGHFRHEIAHSRLVAKSPSLGEFRELFGNERRDYGAALQEYYANGAPGDWPEHFISAYASSHPWEDFAETWTYYFHMVDTLETANAFGLVVKRGPSRHIVAKIDFDPHEGDLNRLIDQPQHGTARSVSVRLSPPPIAKLAFVHDRIRDQAGRRTAPDSGLQAMIGGLRQKR